MEIGRDVMGDNLDQLYLLEVVDNGEVLGDDFLNQLVGLHENVRVVLVTAMS